MKILDLASYVITAVIALALSLTFLDAIQRTIHYEMNKPKAVQRLAVIPPTQHELEQIRIAQECNLAERERRDMAEMQQQARGER